MARDASSRKRTTASPGGIPLAAVRPQLKGWLCLSDDFLMGPRYLRLLEGIARSGSIRAACAATGMSYRSCLDRLRRMERVLGAPVVVTRRGGEERGGAELTPLGEQLVSLFHCWREELARAGEAAYRRALERAAAGARAGARRQKRTPTPP